MMKPTKSIRILTLLLIGLACAKPATAQTVVRATIDSTVLMIGEQTLIHLEITTDKGRQITLPPLSESLVDGVLLLEAGKPDTIPSDNNRVTIKQHLLITSFDSALYVIPPFRVVDEQDTLLSEPLALKVLTIPDADPAKGITDIKPVLKADFLLSDYYIYVYAVLIGLLLICIVMYIIQKRKKKQPLFTFKKEDPKLPPHVEAIKQLDRIKAEKLWQQGKNKKYYSDITDVLRKYIFDRFGVSAMEMTSDEILNEIYRLNDAHSVHKTLKQILEPADLVKFAKYIPLPNDNELCLMNAYLFVNQTKIEALKLPEGETTEEDSVKTATEKDPVK
jgi:hypothetical protein